MSLYEISVFIHVSAVVVGFGATFAEAIMFPVAMKTGVRHLPYVHQLQLAINQRMASPALGLIIVTGIYQTIDGDWGFGSFWISATFAIAIVLGGMQRRLLRAGRPPPRPDGPARPRRVRQAVGRVPAPGAHRGHRGRGRRAAGDRRRLPDGHEAGSVTFDNRRRTTASSSRRGTCRMNA